MSDSNFRLIEKLVYDRVRCAELYEYPPNIYESTVIRAPAGYAFNRPGCESFPQFRPPMTGEFYLCKNGHEPGQARVDMKYPRLILFPITPSPLSVSGNVSHTVSVKDVYGVDEVAIPAGYEFVSFGPRPQEAGLEYLSQARPNDPQVPVVVHFSTNKTWLAIWVRKAKLPPVNTGCENCHGTGWLVNPRKDSSIPTKVLACWRCNQFSTDRAALEAYKLDLT